MIEKTATGRLYLAGYLEGDWVKIHSRSLDRKVLEHLCRCPVDPFSHSFRVSESRSYVPVHPSDPEGLIRHGIDEM